MLSDAGGDAERDDAECDDDDDDNDNDDDLMRVVGSGVTAMCHLLVCTTPGDFAAM